MTSQEKPETSVRRKFALKRILEWGMEVIEWVIHPPVPLITRLLHALFSLGRHVRNQTPRNCDNRDTLYKIGAEMLSAANKTVTTVSTIRGEAFPSKPGSAVANRFVREYFVALHRLAYRNRLQPDKPTSMSRYSNLKDPDKHQEALALLYNGAGVNIRHSEVPVEFVTADETTALVGFPGRDGLFGGFHSYAPQQCRALRSWVEAYGSTEHTATDSPATLVAQIQQLLGKEVFTDHGDDCLCKVTDLLDAPRANEQCAAMFDLTSGWIDDLYEPENVKNYYANIAEKIKYARHGEKRLSFLDVGCGTAFGAHELKRHEISYWGLDISGKMIEKAQEHLAVEPKGLTEHRRKLTFRALHCDAIGTLLGVDPEARNFAKAPKKFDVIACQGNAFDSLLGPVQKALALFLFDQRLHEKGFLVFTGAEFSRDISVVERVPHVGGVDHSIRYEFDWSGEYCRLNVKSEGHVRETSVVMHPCRRDWLDPFVESLGYESVTWQVPTITPRGGKEYYMRVYRRKSAN